MNRPFRPIAEALADFHSAGLPLSGALRLAALHALVDDTASCVPAFAAALASHGHRPTWGELRALIRAGRALDPVLVNPGERLARAGQSTDGLFIVHQGELVARPSGRRGGPMTVFGPDEGLDRGVWLDSIYATRGAVVFALRQDALDALVTACPLAGPALGMGPRGLRRRRSGTTTAPPHC